MQKYFTIGETAEINGISIKTLRHYDEIGLLKPAYIDPVTKYRYYEYGQFPYIDKIKRYKNVGMSLKDIKDFFDHKSLQKLEEYLKQQMDKINKEAEKLEQMKQNTELLITYFNDAKNIELDDRLYKKQENERTIIYCEALPNQDIMELDMCLRQVITVNKLDNYPVINPYGYILDTEMFMKDKLKITHEYVSTTASAVSRENCIMKIPEGEYLCFQSCILSQDAKIDKLSNYLKENNIKPKLIIANEYLKSFYDPIHSPYEIQVLI